MPRNQLNRYERETVPLNMRLNDQCHVQELLPHRQRLIRQGNLYTRQHESKKPHHSTSTIRRVEHYHPCPRSRHLQHHHRHHRCEHLHHHRSHFHDEHSEHRVPCSRDACLQHPHPHDQHVKHVEDSPRTDVTGNGHLQECHYPRQPNIVHACYLSPPVRHPCQTPDNYNDQSHGTPGDWNSRNAKSNLKRCTNCCGRPQVHDPRDTQQDKYSSRYDSSEDCKSAVNTTLPKILSDVWTPRLKGGHGQDDAFESVPSCSAEGAKDMNQGRQDRVLGKTVSAYRSCRRDSSEDLEAELPSSFEDEDEMRLRGGCGGAGGRGGNLASCPCGGCGGAACNTGTTGNVAKPSSSGCCGGNQSRGLPCRCRCRSCGNPSPSCGSCGGQNCGQWNSCSGSGGGKCCFPRNTRRHNGPSCCGGKTGGCGGCY